MAPAKEVDPHAHEEEYISTRVFPRGETDATRHGAFLARPSHTLLITYSRLDDMRAVNQRFGRLDMADNSLLSSGDPVVRVRRTPEGMEVTFEDVKQPGGTVFAKYERPWTYLGPGSCCRCRSARC